TPTAAELEAACGLFDELLGDFPFADEAGYPGAVALLAEPFVRELIDGPTPLHFVDAPSAGTGKGLLTDVVQGVAYGDGVAVMSYTVNEEELRKRLLSVILKGRH